MLFIKQADPAHFEHAENMFRKCIIEDYLF